MTREGEAAALAPIRDLRRVAFYATVGRVFGEAYLEMPAADWPQSGGRAGRHTEAMGYLLADLQYMQRTYPGAAW